MKYTQELVINRNIEQVVALWSDHNNYKEWQDGFQSYTKRAETNQLGQSQADILIDNGKQKIELVETILINELPNSFKALYEHEHMVNTQTTRFETINTDKTRYVVETEYTQFNGFIIKLMAFLMPNMFKKQSFKWMEQFKTFTENS